MIYNGEAKSLYYGTMPVVESVELDQWLDQALAEQVLLESTQSKADRLIKTILKKAKKGEDTEEDVKKLKELMDDAKKNHNIELILAYSLAFAGGVMLGVGMLDVSTISIADAMEKQILAAIKFFVGYSMIGAGAIMETIARGDAVILADKVYNKLLQCESKAMQGLRKAESKNDEQKAKAFKTVIDACEKAKEARKESLRKRTEKEKEIKHDKSYYTVGVKKESVDLVLEYKGNEIKNYTFVQVLEDVDKLMLAFRKRFEQTTSFANSMLQRYNQKAKDPDQLADLLIATEKEMEEWENDDSAFKNQYGPVTWNLLKKYASKFSTKYSQMGMNTRQNFDKKFQSYLNELKDQKDKYREYKYKVEASYQKAKKFDDTNSVKMYNRIAKVVNVGVEENDQAAKLITQMIKTLKVEKLLKSPLYKLLNIGANKKDKVAKAGQEEQK